VVTIAGGGTLDFNLAGNYAGRAFSVTRTGNDSQVAEVRTGGVHGESLSGGVTGTAGSGTTGTTPLTITNDAPAASALAAPVTTGSAGSTVAPVAIGSTSVGAMQFIYPDAAGRTVLKSDAPGQVLSAASGANVLSDAGGFGVTFQGTLADFSKVVIAGFSTKDLVDITDLNSAGVSTSYGGSGHTGVLYLTAGSLSGELHLAGHLAGGSFHVSSDLHGGTLIAFT